MPASQLRIPAAPGFDGKTITIGVLGTTASTDWEGKSIGAAINAHIAAINRARGIARRFPIRVQFEETGNDPGAAAARFAASVPQVIAYASILGSPSMNATLPLVEQAGVLASPTSREALWATKGNLLPVFASYQVQAINGIAYYLSRPGAGQTVCALTSPSPVGSAAFDGVRAAQSALGFNLAGTFSMAPGDPNARGFVDQVRNAGCQAVLVAVQPEQLASLVTAARQSGTSTRWIALQASFNDRTVSQATSPAFESSVWVVGDGVAWGDTSAGGMRLLIDQLIANGDRVRVDQPDPGLAVGWAQALLIEALLEKAVSMGDLSRDGIRRAASQLGVVDFGGLGAAVDYSASPRLSAARTSIFSVDGSARLALRMLEPDYSSPAAQGFRV